MSDVRWMEERERESDCENQWMDCAVQNERSACVCLCIMICVYESTFKLEKWWNN